MIAGPSITATRMIGGLAAFWPSSCRTRFQWSLLPRGVGRSDNSNLSYPHAMRTIFPSRLVMIVSLPASALLCELDANTILWFRGRLDALTSETCLPTRLPKPDPPHSSNVGASLETPVPKSTHPCSGESTNPNSKMDAAGNIQLLVNIATFTLLVGPRHRSLST